MSLHTTLRPAMRPLRPPLLRLRPAKSRRFTYTPPHHHHSCPPTRPQLAFLALPSRRLPRTTYPGHWHLSRLLSTETKRFLQEQAWQGGKWTLYGSILTALGLAWAFALTHELLEREFPTPPEWSFFSRLAAHCARAQQVPQATRYGVTEWGIVGRAYDKLVSRLEDASVDGVGLVSLGVVPGVEAQAWDVTGKSTAWRAGYFDALMGQAKAAEHLDGRVLDVTRSFVFPAEYVIGPSNPSPKPCPPWRPSPPLEENCVPAYAPPETFYLKILMTGGFTTRQRIQAALAYGEWLDFKGVHGAAEEMFRWGLDIASEKLDDPGATIDKASATICARAPVVTENVLAAVTGLGVHFAQTGDMVAALPIFLSVLRARRAAPLDPAAGAGREKPRAPPPRTDIDSMKYYGALALSLFKAVEYPAPPPSGDDPLMRTPRDECDDATLMTYIGEILYAGKDAEAGVQWTREALETAEKVAGQLAVQDGKREKCRECLDVGIENWRAMVEGRVALLEEGGEEKEKKGWFGCNYL
ncbi:hypothetical protein EJ06DRAFT_543147 [Trichodelitschia bisporula]|uniref:Uncharacterized protein n=1 Tax=Trichodelitschia bisporula TaxID=703511 RepID=A0A6G1HWC8_9PEZI|nr:hypothetical protein EJ06DRAFT_543147 [Trichodelitschia bisporula]